MKTSACFEQPHLSRNPNHVWVIHYALCLRQIALFTVHYFENALVSRLNSGRVSAVWVVVLCGALHGQECPGLLRLGEVPGPQLLAAAIGWPGSKPWCRLLPPHTEQKGL